MNKEQFVKQFNILLKELELKKEGLRLFESGGVDTRNYGYDMELPRIILTVALRNESNQYEPFSKDGKRVVENLSHF